MITFTYEGVELSAQPGQSIAAALIANNERITRFTRIENKARGAFCGIGICFDCLIIVNGQSNQRSCITEIQEGMVLAVQHGS